jgi:hypothetical protein
MITTYKITKIHIDKVGHIFVDDIMGNEQHEAVQRTIKITMKNGDCVELILESDSKLSLDFSKDEDAWLPPKLYKGSKNMEE